MRRLALLLSALALASFAIFCSSEESGADEEAELPRRTRDDAAASEGGIGPGPNPGPEGDAAGLTREERYCAEVLADAPLAYWRFEETAGNEVKDERNKYPGKYIGPVELGKRGIFGAGGAVAFPVASNAHVLTQGNAFRFADAAAFTIEAWVTLADFDDTQQIAGTEYVNGGSRQGWSIFSANPGQLHYELWDTVDAGPAVLRTLTGAIITVGIYHHLVVSFAGGALRSYLDGKPGSSSTSNPPKPGPNTGDLRWGARAGVSGFTSGLQGASLDEAAVYDYALPSERITAHYELGRPQ